MTEPLPEQENWKKVDLLVKARVWLFDLRNVLLPELIAIIATYLIWDTRCLRIGDVVEAMDLNNTWHLARITRIRPFALRVHFFGWDSMFDEWISQFCGRFSSRRPKVPSCIGSDRCRCCLFEQIREPKHLSFFLQTSRAGPNMQVGEEIVVHHRPAIVQDITGACGCRQFVYHLAFRDGQTAVITGESPHT